MVVHLRFSILSYFPCLGKSFSYAVVERSPSHNIRTEGGKFSASARVAFVGEALLRRISQKAKAVLRESAALGTLEEVARGRRKPGRFIR